MKKDPALAGKAVKASRRKSEGQASRTSATSDEQEQLGKRQAAGEKGENDARETNERTHKKKPRVSGEYE